MFLTDMAPAKVSTINQAASDRKMRLRVRNGPAGGPLTELARDNQVKASVDDAEKKPTG